LIGFWKSVESLRNDLDREALEGILGSLRWHKNLWFILLTSSTLLYARLSFLHNQTRWATCFIHVLCRITGIERVDEVIYSMDPIFSSGRSHVLYVCFLYEVIRRITCSIQNEHVMCCNVATFCHTCAFRMTNMRGKDALHSKGGCLRLDAVHAIDWYMDTVSIVNGNVCGRFHDVLYRRFVFCRYTNNVS
jgi:hypothetical protein